MYFVLLGVVYHRSSQENNQQICFFWFLLPISADCFLDWCKGSGVQGSAGGLRIARRGRRLGGPMRIRRNQAISRWVTAGTPRAASPTILLQGSGVGLRFARRGRRLVGPMRIRRNQTMFRLVTAGTPRAASPTILLQGSGNGPGWEGSFALQANYASPPLLRRRSRSRSAAPRNSPSPPGRYASVPAPPAEGRATPGVFLTRIALSVSE